MDALITRLTKVRQARSSIEDVVLQQRLGRGETIKNYAAGVRVVREVRGFRYDLSNRSALLNTLKTEQTQLETQLKNLVNQSNIPIAREVANLFPKIPASNFTSVEQVRNRFANIQLFKKEQFTIFVDNTEYNYVPLQRDFSIRSNSGQNPIDAFTKFQKQLYKKYGDARIIIEIYDFSVGNKQLGKRGTTVNELLNMLYKMYQALIKLSEEYDGELSELTYKEFLAGRMRIMIPVPAGGCGNHHKSNDTYRGNDVIRRTYQGCELISKKTKNNNCGLECLRLIGKLPSCHNLRKEFGLKSGEKISTNDMYRIIEKYELDIQIVDPTMTEVRGNERRVCDTIMLSNEHYEILISKIEKSKCKNCGVEYYKTHNCNENKMAYYNIKVLRKKSYKPVKLLYVDLETRNDLCNKYSITGNDYNPQIAVLLAYSLDGVTNHFLGLDCIANFCDFLIKEQENMQFYNIYAHNGSRFDFFFFINEMMSNPLYSMYIQTKNDIFKGSRIISFHFGGHKFIDTMNFMNGSLSKLCEDFKVTNAKKSEFIVNGKKMSSMDICLYDIDLTPQQYIDYLYTNDEMRNAYIEYCKYDCLSLEELHTKFVVSIKEIVSRVYSSKNLPIGKNIKIVDASTLPGYFFKIWKDIECDPTEYNPTEKEREFFNKAIIGGISHVHKKGKFTFTEENPGCVIDVVSLYVSQMIQQQYPKGAPRYVERGYDPNTVGIYRVVDIVFPSSSKGQIKDVPAKTVNGLDWETEYIDEAYLTTMDLERMANNGVQYTMLEGYVWDETYNPFQMLEPITEIKMREDLNLKLYGECNDALRNCCKLAGNSLYGKMMERSKNYTIHNFESVYDIDTAMFDLATNINYSNGHFIIKEESDCSKSPLHFGVFILGYARNCIMTYADMVGRDNIFTMETDSISCRMSDIEKIRNSRNVYSLGKHLGGMDIEIDRATEGIFCAKKCYAIHYYNHKESKMTYKMRFKGVPKSLLNYNVYETLIRDGKIDIHNIAVWRRDLFNRENSGISIGKHTKNIRL